MKRKPETVFRVTVRADSAKPARTVGVFAEKARALAVAGWVGLDQPGLVVTAVTPEPFRKQRLTR